MLKDVVKGLLPEPAGRIVQRCLPQFRREVAIRWLGAYVLVAIPLDELLGYAPYPPL
jgi:hypothetical protein